MGGGHSSTEDGHSLQSENTDVNSVLFKIPEDLIIQILVQVPARDIVKKCVLVSRRMRDIIVSPTLWRMKCELEGKYVAGHMPVPDNFKKFYFFHPYTRNLIKNSCALERLKHWKIQQQGGDNFLVDPGASGCQKIAETDMLKEWAGPMIKTWATSYYPCGKMQTVDLVKEGIEPHILDEIKPRICVSDWFAARFDCACHYELEVKIMDKEKKMVDKFNFSDDIPQWTSGEWTKVEHVFENYKPGVRFVQFRHLGKDKQFWAGHYGPKFTLSTVRLKFHKRS